MCHTVCWFLFCFFFHTHSLYRISKNGIDCEDRSDCVYFKNETGDVHRARWLDCIELIRLAQQTGFQIVVRFLSGLSPAQKLAFKKAAQRWTRVIRGDLPSVTIDNEVIDDLLILAEGAGMDGSGGTLAEAGPTHVRADSGLPTKGIMRFDTADLAAMEEDGTLEDVITHEMGHVLGIGTVWEDKRLLEGAGSADPTFVGQMAMVEYGKLIGQGPHPVPVEGSGGEGTRDSHRRDSVFGAELMTGYVNPTVNPLSAVTVASLGDLGYEVEISHAEPFTLDEGRARVLLLVNRRMRHRVGRPHFVAVVPGM